MRFNYYPTWSDLQILRELASDVKEYLDNKRAMYTYNRAVCYGRMVFETEGAIMC